MSLNAGEHNDGTRQELSHRNSGSQQQAQSPPPEPNSVAAEDARLQPACACILCCTMQFMHACIAVAFLNFCDILFISSTKGSAIAQKAIMHDISHAPVVNNSHQATVGDYWLIGHLNWLGCHLRSCILPATWPCTHFTAPGTLGNIIQDTQVFNSKHSPSRGWHLHHAGGSLARFTQHVQQLSSYVQGGRAQYLNQTTQLQPKQGQQQWQQCE